MQEQQLHDGHVPVPGSVVERGVVLVARGVHQRPVLQQQLHHLPVPVVTRLVLGAKSHGGNSGQRKFTEGLLSRQFHFPALRRWTGKMMQGYCITFLTGINLGTQH